ncbi:rCG48943, partial [Rattus norvegicus]
MWRVATGWDTHVNSSHLIFAFSLTTRVPILPTGTVDSKHGIPRKTHAWELRSLHLIKSHLCVHYS